MNHQQKQHPTQKAGFPLNHPKKAPHPKKGVVIADGPTPKKARHCGAKNLAAADGSLAGQGAAAAPGGPEAPLRGHRRQGGIEVGRSDGRTVGRRSAVGWGLWGGCFGEALFFFGALLFVFCLRGFPWLGQPAVFCCLRGFVRDLWTCAEADAIFAQGVSRENNFFAFLCVWGWKLDTAETAPFFYQGCWATWS